MDARALLRAKKAAATSSLSAVKPTQSPSPVSSSLPVAGPSSAVSTGFTSDEYATKTKGGELKCRICGVLVKYWQPHLSSKQHKQSLAREHTAQLKLQAAQAPKAVLASQGLGDEDAAAGNAVEGYGINGKRALGDTEPGFERDESNEPGPSKRRKVAESTGSTGQTVADPISAVDTELDDFLSSLTALPPPGPPGSGPAPSASSTSKQPYRISQAETQTSYEAAPVRLVHDSGTAGTGAAFGKAGQGVDGPVNGNGNDRGGQADGATAEEEEEEPVVRETNAERVRRERREERDEILGRLEEEQRAQEEADQRVTSLKTKLELMKQRRKEAAEAKARLKSQ